VRVTGDEGGGVREDFAVWKGLAGELPVIRARLFGMKVTGDCVFLGVRRDILTGLDVAVCFLADSQPSTSLLAGRFTGFLSSLTFCKQTHLL